MTLGEKFLKTSMIYFIVGITMGALFTIKPVHDFVLQSPIFAGAHSHINLIGWVSLAIIGGIYMMIKDKPMHSEKIGNTGFWLLNSYYRNRDRTLHDPNNGFCYRNSNRSISYSVQFIQDHE